MANQIINDNDIIEVLVDNAAGTTEKAGTQLKVSHILTSIDNQGNKVKDVACQSSDGFKLWYFQLPLSNDLKHIPLINLPAGYSIAMSSSSNKKTDIDTLYGLYGGGDWGYNWENDSNRKSSTKCECGQDKIVGHEGDNWEHHSRWCPVYKEGKLKVK